MRTVRQVSAAVAAAVLLAAPAARAADWPTFGFDTSRSGFAPAELSLSASTVLAMTERWNTRLEGAVNAQPVVAENVALGGGRSADLVLVGTELGRFYALDRTTGAIVWQRGLGTSQPGGKRGCSRSPEQVFGISGSAVISRSRGRVYVASGRDDVYSLRLSDGRTDAGWPIRVADPAGEHVWGALTLERGLLYATVASYCDAPPFQGAVTAIDVGRHRRVRRWTVAARPGHVRPFGGGIWGWGGASVDPRDGDVYVATGNSLGDDERGGYSERVVRLTRRLRVRQSNAPRLRYPTGDADFGSTPMLFRPAGCPPLLTALNKDGELMLYRRDRIAKGPVQRLTLTPATPIGQLALIGVTAYEPALRMVYVLNPVAAPGSRYAAGLLAFRVGASCRLSLAWQNPADVTALTSAPIVAGGIVWFGTGETGIVNAIAADDGRRLNQVRLGTSVFAAPTVSGGWLLAAGWDGVVHAYRS